MGKAKFKKQFVRITVTACLVSSLLFFTTLDKKLFDLFLRVLPSLTENENIYILTLDDDSINYAGGFPFRREVMADIVVLLKEMGVHTIAFDLSYLDESPNRFDPYYAKNVFDRLLNSGYSLNSIRSYIPSMARDVDEYFAGAIAFSGNTWLTLTMFGQEDLLDGEPIVSNTEIDNYFAEYIALDKHFDNVTILNDTKTPEMVFVMPAIQKLLSRAKGAGFVNGYIDPDGLRRRIHLLLKYNGAYYGNLALMSMREKLDAASIEISNNKITLIKNDGVKINIPRCPDGTMVLKWPKKTFYDYRYMSLVKLAQHTIIEPVLAENVALMNDMGLFSFWDEDATPWDYYAYAERLKNEAFEKNEEADEEWLLARHEFFRTLETFLYGDYEQILLTYIEDDLETAKIVNELFDAVRSQFYRLLEIRREVGVLKNSWCVIGSDATSMTDNGIISFQKNFPNVGTYYTAANMLKSGEFLSEAPWYFSAIAAIIFSLLIAFLISRFDTYGSIITGLSGIVILSGCSLLFFAITKVYPGFAVPLVSVTLTFIGLMVRKFLTASGERAFLHNAFSRYLAPEIIHELINDPGKLNLGGEKREMTAMFTDIQAFSTFSEQLDPVQLVRLLNKYLTAMSNIIMENLGTIDKYEGDAIIAFFGAPVFREDHAVLACRSALAMKRKEAELNKVFLEEGLAPVPIFTRIGINTGEMVVGNMGAENKMDYTIMGNAVNLTARLEGINKQYKTGGILISEYTHSKIGTEFICRRLDRVRVVGIKTPLRLYELLAMSNEQLAVNNEQLAVSNEQIAMNNDQLVMNNTVKIWENAIDLLENRQFEEAEKLFNILFLQNQNDHVARLYFNRCKEYRHNPPPVDWDGVVNLTEK